MRLWLLLRWPCCSGGYKLTSKTCVNRWKRMEGRWLVLQTVKNENKLCCIESVGDRWLLPAKTEFGGRERLHICCGTCKKIPVWQAVIPSLIWMSWGGIKMRGVCIIRPTCSLQPFIIKAWKSSLATQSGPLLLNSIENERHRFHRSMPRTVSFSV